MFQNPYAALMAQQPYYNQPQMMNNQPIMQQQEPIQNLIRVNGIDGAKAYQMPANSTAALFDANNDILYVKSTDGAGFPSIRTFSFTEVKEQQQETTHVDYISREEFENFKKELMIYGKQSIHTEQSTKSSKQQYTKSS